MKKILSIITMIAAMAPIVAQTQISISASDSASIDAFGRWRTSEVYTLFDSKQIFDNQPLFWDDEEISGSGTSSTYSNEIAATRIAVSTNAGRRVRQTFMRFNYQPGKSQLWLMTARMVTAPTNGITARVGMFDDENGIFFMASNSTMYACIRSSSFGGITHESIPQSSWFDPLDGTGPSGLTLDPTKGNILGADYEWLGVGRVRMFVVIDGKQVPVYHFRHANRFSSVYMSTPNLPLRYEIENDGTGPASSMDHICASVMSEGGVEDRGVLRYVSTSGTHIDADTENVTYPILGLRLQSDKVDSVVLLESLEMQVQTASEQGEWSLKWNPTVTPALTWTNVANSTVQVAYGGTNQVTGGTDFTGGFIVSGGTAAGGAGGIAAELKNAIHLGASITGKVDEVYLCFKPIAGSTACDVEGGITWRE